MEFIYDKDGSLVEILTNFDETKKLLDFKKEKIIVKRKSNVKD